MFAKELEEKYKNSYTQLVQIKQSVEIGRGTSLDLRKKFAQHFVDEGDLTMHYGKALRMIMRNEMSLDMVRQFVQSPAPGLAIYHSSLGHPAQPARIFCTARAA